MGEAARKFESNPLDQSTPVDSKPTSRSTAIRPVLYFVDDEPDMLEVFRAFFSHKFEVATFESGFDLVNQIASGAIAPPSLVVTDLRMEQMDGVKMLSALTAMGHNVPAILLTGNLDKESAVDAVNHGIFRILEKPFDRLTLEAYINEVLMEARIHKIRVEVRSHVRRLNEIHQAMRLLLADKVENLDELMAAAAADGNGGQTESLDQVVSRLEKRVDELLRVEELSEALAKRS